MGLRLICLGLLGLVLLVRLPGEAAIRFTANGDSLDRSTGVPPYGDLTKMCWAYRVAANASGETVHVIADSTGASLYLALVYETPTAMAVQANLGSGDGDGVSTTVLALATWYHVTAVFTQATTTWQGYVNGQPMSNPLTSIPSGATPWGYESMGGWSTNTGLTGFNMNGRIGGCKTWTAALSQGQIQAEMLHITPVRVANLQSYAPLRLVTELTSYGGGTTWTTHGTLSTEADPPYAGGVSAGNGFLAW